MMRVKSIFQNTKLNLNVVSFHKANIFSFFCCFCFKSETYFKIISFKRKKTSVSRNESRRKIDEIELNTYIYIFKNYGLCYVSKKKRKKEKQLHACQLGLNYRRKKEKEISLNEYEYIMFSCFKQKKRCKKKLKIKILLM